MAFDFGSALSGGLSFLSGIFNREAESDWRNQQMQMARQQEQLQREFAQSGIQWRVQDAVKAGLHPLAALGNQGVSYSPVSMGDGGAPKYDFGSMGQDLGRALQSAMSQEDRDEKKLRDLTLERAKLQNDVLRQELNSKMMRESRAGGQLGPAMPTGTVPNTWQDFVVGTPSSRSPARSPEGIALADKKQEQNEAPNTEFRTHRPFGYTLRVNPWFDDSQVTTNRFGESELLEMLKGGLNIAGDHIYTLYKNFGEPAEGWRPKRPTHNDAFIRGRR